MIGQSVTDSPVRYDIVVAGGTLVDGTDAQPVRADVAVDGQRVRAIGAPGTLLGHVTLTADDRVVCPGFIDLHSHVDFTVTGHPRADTAVAQGVTTLLTGNCGWSPFPVTDLPGLQAASAFLDPELDWSWSDVAGYADAVEATGPAVNLALQVGHSSLRLAVLGAAEHRPDAAALERMVGLLDQAAEQGAYGFSTGLIYAPGCYAETDEVTALARVAADRGLLYSTHIRNEADRMLDAVAEAIETAQSSGARLELSHLKAMGPANHGRITEALELIEAAQQEGMDVSCDVYPYTASSTTLTSRLPGWAMDGGASLLLDRLADPPTRREIAGELRQRMGRDIDPEGVVIADLPPGPFSGAVGQNIAALGRQLGVDAAEAALQVLECHSGAVAVVNHAMAESDVTAVLRHPLSSVASDGWVLREAGSGRPHPRSFGTFARVLGRYVRDRSALPLTEAVRKMTSLPASRLGLSDRGVLRVGAVADIVVFDPLSVTDRSTYDAPWQLATGVEHVLVAGEPVLCDGSRTAARPGRVLRRT